MADQQLGSVSFDIQGVNGSSIKIHIKPSYPHKPKAISNLLAALPSLLSDASMPSSPIAHFTTTGWDLDETGDTIHRYVELNTKQDVSHVLDAVRIASQSLNHDPHVYINGTQVTFSCTTHSPAGLSMKDVKLARKIDEIVEEVGLAPVEIMDEAEILTQRQRAREHNMKEVAKAKQDCNCG